MQPTATITELHVMIREVTNDLDTIRILQIATAAETLAVAVVLHPVSVMFAYTFNPLSTTSELKHLGTMTALMAMHLVSERRLGEKLRTQ